MENFIFCAVICEKNVFSMNSFYATTLGFQKYLPREDLQWYVNE